MTDPADVGPTPPPSPLGEQLAKAVDAAPLTAATGARSPARGRGRPSDRPARSDDEPRRRQPAGERRRGGGFGDDVERAFCAHLRHRLPETFPVVHRHDEATLRPAVVDRRPGSVLYCDGAHLGAHAWPNGDPVLATDDPSTAPPSPDAAGPAADQRP